MNDALEDNVSWGLEADEETLEDEHILYLEWLNNNVDYDDEISPVEDEEHYSFAEEEEAQEEAKKKREAEAKELKIWLELFDLRYPSYY